LLIFVSLANPKFMMKIITPLAILLLVMGGCDNPRWNSGFTQMGYKPVYASSGDLKLLIKSSPAKALTETGKIYTKGNLLLVNQPFQGVHVIDNTDPANPINTSFLEIPGNIDVSIKGNYMYADYSGKIVVIDISDISHPRVTQNVTLDTHFQEYPPQADLTRDFTWRTYFECPDPKKGVVVGWVYANLNSPKCWRENQ